MTRAEHHLALLARRQHGVFTVRQARALGVSAELIRQRLATRDWLAALGRFVLITAATPLTRAARLSAALLHCGEGAALSHRTAAVLHGLVEEPNDERIFVTVPYLRHPPPVPGVFVTRSRALEGFVVQHQGLQVVCPARAIVDLGAGMSGKELTYLLHRAVQRKQVTIADVAEAAAAVSGRRGAAGLRTVLRRFDPTYDSGLEAAAGALFDRAGIWLSRQVEVAHGGTRLARLDFADEELKVGIQIDGLLYHSDLAAVRRDRAQDRALERLGWEILRFTSDDILHRPDWVIEKVRQVLARRAAERRAAFRTGS